MRGEGSPVCTNLIGKEEDNFLFLERFGKRGENGYLAGANFDTAQHVLLPFPPRWGVGQGEKCPALTRPLSHPSPMDLRQHPSPPVLHPLLGFFLANPSLLPPICHPIALHLKKRLESMRGKELEALAALLLKIQQTRSKYFVDCFLPVLFFLFFSVSCCITTT